MQPAVRHCHEDQREAPRGSSRREALERSAIGVVELVDAEVVHRGIALPEEELSLVEFGDAGEHDRGRGTLASGRRSEFVQQIAVAEVGSNVGIRGHVGRHDPILQRGLV
jgi:hypothetical protein